MIWHKQGKTYRSIIALVIVSGILAACGKPDATPTPAPTATPTIGTTSAPPSPIASDLPPEPTATLTRTPRPTRTPTHTPEQTNTPTHTPTPLPPDVPTPTPTIRGVSDAPPPFDISLPVDWAMQFNALELLRPDAVAMPVKVAFYVGPVPTEHAARITVLWDYAHLNDDVWRDGIVLSGVVFDPSCHFNLVDLQAMSFQVGMHYADGIRFNVTQCENEPDVTGWLVGYRRAEINYLFYVSIQPMENTEGAIDFVQSVLDTIRFPDEE